MTLRLLLLLPACLALLFNPCQACAMDTPETPVAGDNGAMSQGTPEPSAAPAPGTAEAPPAATPPAGDNTAGVDNTWVDWSHDFVEMGLFTAADRFDRYLGGDAPPRGGAPASAAVWWKNDFRYDGVQHYTFRTAFRVGLRLPRLSNRWRVVIAGENKGDPTAAVPVDPGTPGTNVASPVRTSSAGLVYDVFRTEQTYFDLGAGLKIDFPLDPYGRARLGYVHPLGIDTLGRFTITGAYHAQDGPGVSNQLDFEHRISRATGLIWSNSASLSEETNGWAWGTELSLVHALSGSSSFKVGGSVRGDTRPAYEVQNYRVFTGYRRSIFRNWLFWELEPDVNWPLRPDGTRDPVYGATLRLEIHFLGKAAATKPAQAPPASPPPPGDLPAGERQPFPEDRPSPDPDIL